MELDLSQNAIAALKSDARAFRQEQTWNGTPKTQAQALEHVAHVNGARDWNTLSAKIRKPVRLAPGQKVRGHYLNQPFTGRLTAVQLLPGDKVQVTAHFDEPVDVVTFDSFSAFRSRVSAVLGSDGRALRHTSDGTPHMVIDLIHQ